jgi:hypothetical protein
MIEKSAGKNVRVQEISDCLLLNVELAMSMRQVYVAGILASWIARCSISNAFETFFGKLGCLGLQNITDRMTTELNFLQISMLSVEKKLSHLKLRHFIFRLKTLDHSLF